MKSNVTTSTYIFLAATFAIMTLGFSFNLIDFNHTKDGILTLILLLLGLWAFRHPTPKINIPHIIIISLPILLLSILIHGGRDYAISTHIYRTSIHYLLVILFLFYFINLVPREDLPRTLSKCLLTSALAVSLLTWIQYFNLTPALFPAFPNYDQHIYSVFGNQNLLGGFIAIVIPILVYRLTRESTPARTTILLLLLLTATCLITGSRSAWLAAIIGSVCAIPFRSLTRSHYIVGMTLTLTVIIIMLLNHQDTTSRITNSFTIDDVGFHIRTWIWGGSILLLKNHFLLGIGPGMFQYWSPQYLGDILHTTHATNMHPNEIHTLQAHSTPLDLIIEFGIAGVGCCIAWCTILIKNRKNAVWGSAVAITIYASLNTITQSTPHLLSALLLCTALSKSDLTLSLSQTRSRVLYTSLLIVLVLPTTILYALTTLYPSLQLAQARNSYTHSDTIETTRTLYQQAAQNTLALPQTHLEFALLLLNDSPEKALHELTLASQGLDTGEVNLALGQAGNALGDHESSLRFTERGVYRWPGYYPGWEQWLQYSTPENRPALLEKAKPFLNAKEQGKLFNNYTAPTANHD